MEQCFLCKHVILSVQFSMTETLYPELFSRFSMNCADPHLCNMSGHAEDTAKPQALLQGGVTVYSPRPVIFFAPSVQEGPGRTLRKGCTFLGPALLYHKITCWLVRPIKWGFMIGFATVLYMSTVNIHLAHGFLKFCLDICTISGLGKGRFPARWLSQP